MLSVNRQAGYVLGIDLDYKHIQYTISDLGGNPVHYQSETFETTDSMKLFASSSIRLKPINNNGPRALTD